MKTITLILIILGMTLLAGCASISKDKVMEIAREQGIPAAYKAIDKAVEEGRLGSANAEDLREFLENYEK